MKKYNTLVGKIVAVITVLIFSTSGTIFSWVEDTSFDNTQATFTDIDLLDSGASSVGSNDLSTFFVDPNYEILEYRDSNGNVVSKDTPGAVGHLPKFWDIKDIASRFNPGPYGANNKLSTSIGDAAAGNMFISSDPSWQGESYLPNIREFSINSSGISENGRTPDIWAQYLFNDWDPFLLDAIVRSSTMVTDDSAGNQGNNVDYFTADFLIAPPSPITQYNGTYDQSSQDNTDASLWTGSLTINSENVDTYASLTNNDGTLVQDPSGDIMLGSINLSSTSNSTALSSTGIAYWANAQTPENLLWLINPTANFNLNQLVYGDESWDHPLDGLNVQQLFAESHLVRLCENGGYYTDSDYPNCWASDVTADYESMTNSYWTDTDNDGMVDSGDVVDGVGFFTAQSDIDSDGIPDAVDTDIDGDGVDNDVDAFPNDATETVDTDGDGTGDVADTDDDGDGVDDSSDGDPLDSMIGGDDDGDGSYAFLGSSSDYTSLTLSEQQAVDIFDDNASETIDADGNGTGDNADSAATTSYAPSDAFVSAELASDSSNANIGDNGHDMDNTTPDKISKTNIEIAHSTPATIGFEVKHSSDAGKLTNEQTIIAAFHVVNNTMDGFQVTLTSANGGKLLPVSGQHLHGETSIDYTLDIEKGISPMLSQQGSIEGENVNTQGLGHFNITDKAARTLINGQGQSSGTNSSYVISIKLDDESSDSGYGLAGIYKEALLLTYQDF